jgi:hypothetical protein
LAPLFIALSRGVIPFLVFTLSLAPDSMSNLERESMKTPLSNPDKKIALLP